MKILALSLFFILAAKTLQMWRTVLSSFSSFLPELLCNENYQNLCSLHYYYPVVMDISLVLLPCLLGKIDSRADNFVPPFTLYCHALFLLSYKYTYILGWKVGRVHDGKLLVDLIVAQLNTCHNWPVFCICDKGNGCFSLLEVDYEWILVIIKVICVFHQESGIFRSCCRFNCLAVTLCILNDMFVGSLFQYICTVFLRSISSK